MRALLLGLAAPLAAIPLAAPANAQAAGGSGIAVPGDGQWADRDGKRHERRRPRGAVVVGGGFWGSPEAWALYNNRTFAPDSFNDWWHERPWRAYPRWMQSNQNCDRMWWGGGVWRCSW